MIVVAVVVVGKCGGCSNLGGCGHCCGCGNCGEKHDGDGGCIEKQIVVAVALVVDAYS